MSAQESQRQWFQFRLSFVLCVVFFMAIAFAGGRFDEGALKLDPGSFAYDLLAAAWVFSGPVVAATVLLIGRNTVVAPMASGILCAVAIGLCCWLANMGVEVTLSIAYLLGSWFGLIRMLFSAITPARILLGVPISFFSGAWLVVVTRMLFERIGGP